MDFDYAVNKLNREHDSIRRTNRNKQIGKISAKKQQTRIQKLAEERRKKQRAERRLKEKANSVIIGAERELRLLRLSSKADPLTMNDSLQLKPVSVWGEGDKITLPTNVLEFLMMKFQNDLSGVDQPMTFRIGVLNPNYDIQNVPVCESIRKYAENAVVVEEEDDDDLEAAERNAMYREEMNEKYLSYTFATVQEFTQDEGFVGIPSIIAQTLCIPKEVPKIRTVDPSTQINSPQVDERIELDNNGKDAKEHNTMLDADMDNEEKTPGHIAWGAFDVPNLDVEICMVTLPKGEALQFSAVSKCIYIIFFTIGFTQYCPFIQTIEFMI